MLTNTELKELKDKYTEMYQLGYLINYDEVLEDIIKLINALEEEMSWSEHYQSLTK